MDFLFQIFCDNKIQQIFARKTSTLKVVDLFPGFCICKWNKLIKAKAISPLTFSLDFFLNTKFKSKAAIGVVVQKKMSLKLWEYSQETSVFKSIFNKVAGLQDCCKTYLFHTQLRFYFSSGKTLKTFINFLLTMFYKKC